MSQNIKEEPTESDQAMAMEEDPLEIHAKHEQIIKEDCSLDASDDEPLEFDASSNHSQGSSSPLPRPCESIASGGTMSVQDIFALKPLSLESKLKIKSAGRPTPLLPNLRMDYCKMQKTYTRKFNPDSYSKWPWLCGCPTSNALYCFPCILFGGEPIWAESGFTNLSKIKEKCEAHTKSVTHFNNYVSLQLLGHGTIQKAITGAAHTGNLIQHNNLVSKNRRIVSHILRCILFCTELELPLQSNDESETSDSRKLIFGVINLRAELVPELRRYLEESDSRESASYLSIESQNELLDCCWKVYLGEVKEELVRAHFVALMVGETTSDISETQLVIVFRYLLGDEIRERFWGYFTPSSTDGEAICKLLLDEVKKAVGKATEKIIGHTFDGVAMMGGKEDEVSEQFQSVYPNAHYIHCYAHQSDSVLNSSARSTSTDRFFAQVTAVANYFTQSPSSLEILNKYEMGRTPLFAGTSLNFKNWTILTIKDNFISILGCLEEINPLHECSTIIDSSILLEYLNSDSFKYWLRFYSDVSGHLFILFDSLQSPQLDIRQVQTHIDTFETELDKIEDGFKSHLEGDYSESAEVTEVIQCIKEDIRRRLHFKGHLAAQSLFDCAEFLKYDKHFPTSLFVNTVKSYPFINARKLKIELEIFYSQTEFQTANGLVGLLKLITTSNLTENFPEAYKVIQILLTVPMTTLESERKLSIFQRTKSLEWRNNADEMRLSALTALCVNQEMFASVNIEKRIIEMFAEGKESLMFKK